jgi:predicted nucleic acid-binding protein
MRYLDTSFLTPLIKQEPTSERVTRFVAGLPARELTISHWTRVEFSSVLAREVRMGAMDTLAADAANTLFDSIIAESFTVLLPGPSEFDLARQFIARYESGLRAGDALDLAIASTHRATAIYSLDKTLIKAGTLFGLPVSDGAIG